MQNFRKIAKLRCREICEPQNREINVSRKFHVIRYLMWTSSETLIFTGKTVKSKNSLTCENAVAQTHGSWMLRVMGS